MVRLLVLVGAGLLCGATLLGQDSLKSDAASMEKKLTAIMARSDSAAPKPGGAVRTSFTDREANAYFKVNAADVLPDGLVDPQIAIDDGGKVHGRGFVDLDAIKKQRNPGWFDPLAWMSGRSEVTVAGVLQATNGKGQFNLESFTLNGVAMPPAILQLLVSAFSKSADRPDGFAIDRPFDMPAKIRAVEMKKGSMTVVQ